MFPGCPPFRWLPSQRFKHKLQLNGRSLTKPNFPLRQVEQNFSAWGRPNLMSSLYLLSNSFFVQHRWTRQQQRNVQFGAVTLVQIVLCYPPLLLLQHHRQRRHQHQHQQDRHLSWKSETRSDRFFFREGIRCKKIRRRAEASLELNLKETLKKRRNERICFWAKIFFFARKSV